jgi:hypothetical protein
MFIIVEKYHKVSKWMPQRRAGLLTSTASYLFLVLVTTALDQLIKRLLGMGSYMRIAEYYMMNVNKSITVSLKIL